MLHPALLFDLQALSATCRQYGVHALSVFGSATREDFRTDSDVDILVEFKPEHAPSLFRLVEMREDLEAVFGRPVDLATEDILRNPYRRQAIVKDMERLYAA